MDNKLYKVIGVSRYEGTSRNGAKYTLITYEVAIDDTTKAKIKTFEDVAQIGDFLQISVGLKKSIYGNELAAVVVGVRPAAEVETK